MTGTKVSRSFCALSLLALGVTGVSGCGAGGSDAGYAADTEIVQRRTIEVRADAAGEIRPVRIVDVQSKASGEVVRILVETGDRVTRGTLLAEIDPRDVANALNQAEADLRVAEARLQTSISQRERAEEMFAANIITQQEYEAAQLDEANARSQLIRAQLTYDLALERMNDVQIRAPIDGVVIQRSVEEGTIIQSATSSVSGGTTLLQMADLSEMEVRTLIDETDIGRIVPGQEVRVTVQAYPGRVFTGEVLKIEPQAVLDQSVTMFPVLIRLDNREGLLLPGMNAEVQIEIDRREQVVAVPNSAVVVPRDAVAAAALVGVSEEEVNAVLAGGAGGAPRGFAAAAPPAGDEGAQVAATGQAQADSAGAPAAGPGAAAPGGMSEECQALFARLQQGGGFASLSESERDQLRSCAPAGMGRQGGAGGFGGMAGGFNGQGGFARPGGNARQPFSQVSTALVFVVRDDGRVEPRRVTLGISDWDYAEVLSGVEEGERVMLMSVAAIQEQQQRMMDRIRGTGGTFPGMGMPAGGRGVMVRMR